jgi:hypothetical protein
VSPGYGHYDHVVMLGGLVRANLWRTAYAAHLLSRGVTDDNVTAVSGCPQPRSLTGYSLQVKSVPRHTVGDP